MITKDDYITIYDKDWKSKGYGKISDQKKWKGTGSVRTLSDCDGHITYAAIEIIDVSEHKPLRIP